MTAEVEGPAPPDVGNRPEEDQAAAKLPTDISMVPTAAGIETVEAWRSAAYAAIKTLADSGAEWTADDVVELVGRQPHHRKQLGSVLGAAARYGRIVAVGATFGRSGRLIRIWTGSS